MRQSFSIAAGSTPYPSQSMCSPMMFTLPGALAMNSGFSPQSLLKVSRMSWYLLEGSLEQRSPIFVQFTVENIKIRAMRIRNAKFCVRLYRNMEGGFGEKMRKMGKYSSLYHYHLTQQQQTMRRNLEQYHKARALAGREKVDYYKRIMSKYFQIRRKIIQKGTQNVSQLKDQNLRESIIKNLMKEGFEKLSLFYESLQNLVEGRREVLQNQEFVFQDGKSVKQKRENFEKFIERFFGKKQKKTEAREDEFQQQ